MKNTDDLQQELMDAPNLTEFLSDNNEYFMSASIPDLLNQFLIERELSKAALAKLSGMSEIYLHQIFAGKRSPSRNRLLCLCFGLNATLETTQTLLRSCGLAQLYPKNRRDAIIIYGIIHEIPLFDINDQLFQENEETLC